MTFIVGMRQPGVTAILADARVSWRGPYGRLVGHDNCVKTGILFPGCVYGRAGSEKCSRDFIVGFRTKHDGASDTIAGFWERLHEYTRTYQFEQAKDRQFDLLLSKRSSGTPTFHYLSSSQGISDQEHTGDRYYSVGIGSGVVALNDFMRDTVTERLVKLRKHLRDEMRMPIELVHETVICFLCMWLTELSVTTPDLAELHGVGGVFHFIVQTPTGEAPQLPSVYVFSTADKMTRRITSWVYRVVHVRGGLYVESSIPPGQSAEFPNGRLTVAFCRDPMSPFTDESADQQRLAAELTAELQSLPYYRFCGFGHTNTADRGSFMCRVSDNGKREHLFDADGSLSESMRMFLATLHGETT